MKIYCNTSGFPIKLGMTEKERKCNRREYDRRDIRKYDRKKEKRIKITNTSGFPNKLGMTKG